MNPSNQDVSVSGLLGATAAAPGRSPVATGTSADGESNSLNKKEFSSVLGREQQRRSESVTPVQGGAATGGQAPSVPIDEAAVEVFVPVVDGKLLPLEGGKLPLEGGVVFLTAGAESEESSLLSEVAQASESIVPEGISEVLSPQGVDADLQTAVTADDSAKGADPLPESDPAEAGPEVIPSVSILPNLIAGPGQHGENPADIISQLRQQVGMSSSTAVNNGGQAGGFAPVSIPVKPASAPSGGEPANSDALLKTPGGEGLVARLQQTMAVSPEAVIRNMPAAGDPKNTTTADQTLPSLTGIASAMSAAGDKVQPQTPTVPTYNVPVEVGKPGWSDQVVQRVMWMSAQNISKAEIALDPPELGPLQVRVQSQGEHMTVVFTSAHGAVRDALDQGLPRLRDMLDSQGLDLVDVDVADEQSQPDQRSGEDEAPSEPPYGQSLLAEDSSQEILSQQDQVGGAAANLRIPGLVDHYV